MILDEAIKHCEEKAEELRKPKAYTDIDGNLRATEPCLECAEELEQLAEWLKELQALKEFANWVTGEVLDDEFEDSSGAFAEIACRKLVKLGYIKLDGDTYSRNSVK